MRVGPLAEGVRRRSSERLEDRPSGCFSNCPTCRRLRRAAVELAARDGLGATTSARIADLAEVPLERAMEHYPTLEDCLAAAYDEGALRLRRVFVRALRGSGSWHERLRAAIDAAVDEFRTRPELGRFCMVEAARSDLPVLCASRLAARERLVAILAQERGPEADDLDLPELRYEVLVGAAHHVVSEQLDGNQNGGSVRERLDQIIDLFEPEPEPVA